MAVLSAVLTQGTPKGKRDARDVHEAHPKLRNKAC
jgi:hypothetical protein